MFKKDGKINNAKEAINYLVNEIKEGNYDMDELLSQILKTACPNTDYEEILSSQGKYDRCKKCGFNKFCQAKHGMEFEDFNVYKFYTFSEKDMVETFFNTLTSSNVDGSYLITKYFTDENNNVMNSSIFDLDNFNNIKDLFKLISTYPGTKYKFDRTDSYEYYFITDEDYILGIRKTKYQDNIIYEIINGNKNKIILDNDNILEKDYNIHINRNECPITYMYIPNAFKISNNLVIEDKGLEQSKIISSKIISVDNFKYYTDK